jgi:hypothetical protein
MGSAKTDTPHLFSAVMLIGVAATTSLARRIIAIHLEHKSLRAIAARVFELKNQGLVDWP